jgi:hypothetical protein
MNRFVLVAGIILLFAGVWVGHLFVPGNKDTTGVLLIVTLLAAIETAAFLFSTSSVVRVGVTILVLLVGLFLLVPLPSIAAGVTINNQTKEQLLCYIISSVPREVRHRLIQPDQSERIRLCGGDDWEAIGEHTYIIVCIDSKATVRHVERIRVGSLRSTNFKILTIHEQ